MGECSCIKKTEIYAFLAWLGIKLYHFSRSNYYFLFYTLEKITQFS